MRKKTVIAVLRYVILAAILLFGVWYVWTNYERFASQARFTVWNVALLVLLNLATIWVEGFRLTLMVRKLARPISPLAGVRYLSITQALNHILLKAGTFSVGYYLSKKYRFPFHSFVAFVVPYVVVMTLFAALTGLFVSVVFLLTGQNAEVLIPLFFLVIITGCAGFILIARFSYVPHFLPAIVRKVIGCWNEIYSDYRLLMTLGAVEIAYFSLCSVRFIVAASMFSTDVSLLGAVVVLTVGNFLRIAAIVPGGIGVAEVASGWTAAFFGTDPGVGVLAAGIDRIVYVAFIMLIGAFSFFTLGDRLELHDAADDDVIIDDPVT